MIDLHTHVLPDMDDGARTVEESLRLLSDAGQQGVTLCVATPHCILHHADSLQNFLEKRQDRYGILKEAIDASPDPAAYPELRLGAEVYLDHDISRDPGIERLCIADTPFLLFEFADFGKYNPKAVEWLYSLSMKQIRPLVAHVDRYAFFEEFLADAAELDITYQVNAESFLSFSGRARLKQLMKNGCRFLASSDMHRDTTRPCRMLDAYVKGKKFLGSELAEKVFYGRAGKILSPAVRHTEKAPG